MEEQKRFTVVGFNSMCDYIWSQKFDKLGEAIDYYADRNPDWYETISVYDGDECLMSRTGKELENEGL